MPSPRAIEAAFRVWKAEIGGHHAMVQTVTEIATVIDGALSDENQRIAAAIAEELDHPSTRQAMSKEGIAGVVYKHLTA